MSKNKLSAEDIAQIWERTDTKVITHNNKTVVVIATLPNGFVIVESRSCVDPVNFSEEIGTQLAEEKIINKIWELEGYKLQCELNEKPLKIAELCHEVNRAFCKSIGDHSQPSWKDAPQWQKDSAVNGVHFHLNNETTPEQSHENWMKEKIADGWVYGDVKNPEKKEHPCMVPYNELPIEQRTKDYLFKAVVDTHKHKRK